MGTREKLFRQKLADQIETLLTTSEKVFTSEKLDNEWLGSMLTKTQELTSALTIYQFLHELPENEKLQVEFLELKEEEETKIPESEIPSYGDEILKEIDEFESQQSVEVFEVVEEPVVEKIDPEPKPEPEPEVIETQIEEVTEVEEPKAAEVVVEAVVIEEVKEEIEEAIVVEEIVEVEIVAEPETVVEEVELVEEIVADEIEEAAEEIAPIQEEIKEESTPKAPVVTKVETKAEINDAMANTTQSLAEKLSAKSIKKLAESIALNERFLFANELFDGNMEAFKRALTELDHIASKEDAQRYIELQLKAENNWDMESETVINFVTLVERRFN